MRIGTPRMFILLNRLTWSVRLGRFLLTLRSAQPFFSERNRLGYVWRIPLGFGLRLLFYDDNRPDPKRSMRGMRIFGRIFVDRKSLCIYPFANSDTAFRIWWLHGWKCLWLHRTDMWPWKNVFQVGGIELKIGIDK